MPKGKAKSRYDFEKKTCEFIHQESWCNLPKFKRCKHVIRCADGSKACYIKT